MRLDDCFQLGKVIKPHGLKGQVSVLLETDYPENYTEMESVFVLVQNKLVPFFIESIDIQRDRATIKFDGIDSQEDALTLRDAVLYLPLDVLPPLEGTSFYFHEITGFTIVDEKLGPIGLVQAVYDSGAQNLISALYNDKEILIPVHDDILKHIDREEEKIFVSLPDGLIDLYMSE